MGVHTRHVAQYRGMRVGSRPGGKWMYTYLLAPGDPFPSEQVSDGLLKSGRVVTVSLNDDAAASHDARLDEILDPKSPECVARNPDPDYVPKKKKSKKKKAAKTESTDDDTGDSTASDETSDETDETSDDDTGSGDYSVMTVGGGYFNVAGPDGAPVLSKNVRGRAAAEDAIRDLEAA